MATLKRHQNMLDDGDILDFHIHLVAIMKERASLDQIDKACKGINNKILPQLKR